MSFRLRCSLLALSMVGAAVRASADVPGTFTMYIDVNSFGSVCPIDAADPNAAYAPTLQASILGIAGVSSANVTSYGCLSLSPNGDLLRWSFNVESLYDPDVIDLPTVLTNYDDADPPALCGDTLLASFCNWFDNNLTTAVACIRGNSNGQPVCDVAGIVVGLVDNTFPNPAAPDSSLYLAGQFVGVFFIAARTGTALARIDQSKPHAATGDDVALKLVVDVADSVTVHGRMLTGPQCPVLFETTDGAVPTWNPSANMAVGQMNQLTDFGFRAYSETNNLLGLMVTISVTQKGIGEFITANDVIDLNWQCSYQTDKSACTSANGNWVDFAYSPDTVKLWMRTRGQACSGGNAVDYNGVAQALSFSNWTRGQTVTAAVGSAATTTAADAGAVCTSPALNGESRILRVAVTAFGTEGGPSTYYVDVLYLWGAFSIAPQFLFSSYFADFTFA